MYVFLCGGGFHGFVVLGLGYAVYLIDLCVCIDYVRLLVRLVIDYAWQTVLGESRFVFSGFYTVASMFV